MAESEKYISYASAKWHLYREFITDKEAAKKAFRALSAIPAADVVERASGIIGVIPAADVRPVVKAHFKLVDGYSITALGYDIKGLECSNCGATFIAQSWVQRFHYCPNCGAMMEES